MSQYAVEIKETLSRTVIVEDAASFLDAVDQVTDAYRNCDIVLDADDFDDKEIGPSETFGEAPIAENDERLEYYEKLKA